MPDPGSVVSKGFVPTTGRGAPPKGDNFFGKLQAWHNRHPYWTLTLLVLAALVPFLTKPFNIDDPLFIWAAQQIHAHPGNPYGFDVNWYGWQLPMSQVTKNPPLACYYLALAGLISGWSEVSLHFAFLFPAVAAILGTCRLAGLLCRRPVLAALLTLFSPVFLISSTTVMCDVLMLAFWVWAMVFWIEGLNRSDPALLIASGVLMGLAAVTKYFGVCLVPLLLVYGLISKRRLGWWAAAMIIPLAALAVDQVATRILYGHASLAEAGHYAEAHRTNSGLFNPLFTALTFTGGCLAMALFYAPLLWRKRMLLLLVAVGLLVAGSFLVHGTALMENKISEYPNRSLVFVQVVVWVVGGICVLALVVPRIFTHRDAQSWMLALWVCGTFLFAAFFNWTINGRTILPMAPAVGILIARQLDQNARNGWKIRRWGLALSLGMGSVLAMLATRADSGEAAAVRKCAEQVYAEFGNGKGTLWFQGHWGFQYYMENLGASPANMRGLKLGPADFVVLPSNNTNIHPLPPAVTIERGIITVPGPEMVTTMNTSAGSGFYASSGTLLPFVFDSAPPEEAEIISLNPAALKHPPN